MLCTMSTSLQWSNCNQSRHAKSCGPTITPKCSEHGTGIAEIAIPSPTNYCVGKLCSVYNNHIQSCLADLAYYCEDPSCANVCHLSATCSGFTVPRGTVRASALFTRIWHCHLHSSPAAGGPSSLHQHTSPTRPTPPLLNSILIQGMSLADTKISKEKYAKCSAALRSNNGQ